jgi:hemolysin III
VFTASEAGEELANSLTHGVGLVLGLVAYCWILSLVSQRDLTNVTVACAVYGATLVLLYAASTAYHATPRSTFKDVLRRFDHSCVYALIAGTYTPFISVLFASPLKWGILGGVWGATLMAAWVKSTVADEQVDTAAWSCVSMGWLGVFLVHPLVHAAGAGCVLWLVGGGVLYTVGVYFYLNDDRPLYHAAWHMFALGGSTCHFAAIWLYIVPLA